jgi:hypothetical protein
VGPFQTIISNHASVHGAEGREFLAWGRLLKRDGLVHLTGYRTSQGWLSRTLTSRALSLKGNGLVQWTR